MVFSEKKHGAVSKHESLTMQEGLVYLKEFDNGEIAQIFIKLTNFSFWIGTNNTINFIT